MKIWDGLQISQGILDCACAAPIGIYKYLEEKCVIQLFMGMKDTYKVFRCQILRMNPFPTISSVTPWSYKRNANETLILLTPSTLIQLIWLYLLIQFLILQRNHWCVLIARSLVSKSHCYKLIYSSSTFKFTKSKRKEPKSIVQIVTTYYSSTISQDQYHHLIQI